MPQNQAIYDARQLGRTKMFILGVQHMFAMFGATVLVPALTGLSVSATLLFAGLGTLLFHFLTKRKVPAFLGSSFAFIWGKGMVKIIPILLGVVGSYGVAVICQVTGMHTMDPAKLQALADAPWIGLPFQFQDTLFGLFSRPDLDTGLLLTAAVTIMPLSLATMVEHIGDMCAISSTCERNYLQDPGFHRTLLGDGLATTLASIFGAPANTTYGENTGVLALSKVYDPRVIRIAAGLAILFSFSPKFAALVSAMPTATMGGVSMVLYGMISAVGVRNVVENQVDFTNSRNVIIAALIMVLAIGINYSGAVSFQVGEATISLSGLAVAAITGIVLNAILPGKDYEFGHDEKGDTAVNFKV